MPESCGAGMRSEVEELWYVYKPVTPFVSEAVQGDFSHLASWRRKGIAMLRVAFGGMWAIDAWFKWQPGFASTFTGYLARAVNGQSSTLASWMSFWFHIGSTNPHLFAILLAAVETAIAAGLLLGAFTNLTCVAGVLLSFVTWSTVGGFAGLYGPDLGVSTVYALVFIGILLSDAGLIFGIDRYFSGGLGRWSFLASGAARRERQDVSPEAYPVKYPHLVPYPVEEPALKVVAPTNAATRERQQTIKRRRLSRM
jgi:uncharacterized membrane protein YphA (DoxX/SURF4 family)